MAAMGYMLPQSGIEINSNNQNHAKRLRYELWYPFRQVKGLEDVKIDCECSDHHNLHALKLSFSTDILFANFKSITILSLTYFSSSIVWVT